MITLTNENIKSLKLLGFGTYGHVYRDGNFAYKIYKPKINHNYGQISNPCLARFNPARQRLMKKAGQKISFFLHVIVNNHLKMPFFT